MFKSIALILESFVGVSILLLLAIACEYVFTAERIDRFGPLAIAKPKPRNAILRRRLEWATTMIFSAGCSMAAYGLAGSLTGYICERFISVQGLRPVLIIWFIAIDVWWFARITWPEYRHYATGTNFRVRIRGMITGGLETAHRYYLLDFAWRRVRAVSALATWLTILPVGAWLLAYDIRSLHSGASPAPYVLVVVGMMVGLGFIRRLAVTGWLSIRPELALIGACLGRWHSVTGEPGEDAVRIFSASAWRSDMHRLSYKIARELERCVPATVRRLPRQQADQVALAGRKLAESLRAHALDNERDINVKYAFDERKLFALRLATAENPAAVARTVLIRMRNDPEPPPLPRRRIVLLASITNDAISAYWPALRIVLIIVALAVLLFVGRYTQLLGLLGK